MNSTYSQIKCFEGIESVYAHYKDEHFSPHVHEGYAIGIIERGAQKFFYKGGNHLSGAGSLVAVNADAIHTGQSASDNGWSYRAIYPTPEVVNRVLADYTDGRHYSPSFQTPTIENPALTNHLRTLFEYSDIDAPALVLESLLITFLSNLARASGSKLPDGETTSAKANIERVRDYIREYSHQNLTIDELANLAGINKYTLLRQFKQAYGLAPHQYQIQLRIRHAQTLLRQGVAPSIVATDSGFYDQSHLSAHFKKALGVTPKHYLNGMQMCRR